MTRRDSRGQSLVEFALIAPIFFLLLIGLFDVGRAIYAYNTVNNAARQGARLAIVDQTVSHIEERATSEAASLGLAAGDVDVAFVEYDAPTNACGAFVADGLPDAEPGGIRNCMAVVTVTYAYTAATPLIGQLMGDIDLVGESQFRLDFYCEGPLCPVGE